MVGQLFALGFKLLETVLQYSLHVVSADVEIEVNVSTLGKAAP